MVGYDPTEGGRVALVAPTTATRVPGYGAHERSGDDKQGKAPSLQFQASYRWFPFRSLFSLPAKGCQLQSTRVAINHIDIIVCPLPMAPLDYSNPVPGCLRGHS